MPQRYVFKTQKFDAIQLPQIAEKRGKDWIDFGTNNLYPDLLIKLYNESAMHHTAIDAKVDAITGKGIKHHGDFPVNSHGETLDEVFEKVAKDYIIFGGYALNVIWNRVGDGLAEIYHMPFNTVRAGKMNEDEKVEDYYYCSDWAQYRKYKPTRHKSFNTTDNKGDDASQIFYYYDYTVGNTYYPLPSYVGAVNDIDLDSRISRFHNANISNGLAPSMMLTFRNGIPTQDEQDDIWRDVNETFGGENNAGRAFIAFAEPGREPTLDAIPNANDTYYTTLEERVTSRILTAHRITSPLLLGIRDSSGFSSNADEIQTGFNHFLGTVIIPDQKKLLKSLQKLVRFFGLNVKLEVEQAQLLYTEEQGTKTVDQTNIIE